jgi:hypothetical protein
MSTSPEPAVTDITDELIVAVWPAGTSPGAICALLV